MKTIGNYSWDYWDSKWYRETTLAMYTWFFYHEGKKYEWIHPPIKGGQYGPSIGSFLERKVNER